MPLPKKRHQMNANRVRRYIKGEEDAELAALIEQDPELAALIADAQAVHDRPRAFDPGSFIALVMMILDILSKLFNRDDDVAGSGSILSPHAPQGPTTGVTVGESKIPPRKDA